MAKLGLVRCSHVSQHEDRQVQSLQEYGCERIFIEKVSGVTDPKDRTALQELLDYARKGDVLVVTELSRLARSVKSLLEITETLDSRGIELVSLKEKLDTTSPTGIFLFQILGTVNEFQRNIQKELQANAYATYKAQGRKFGRPKVKFEVLQKAVDLYKADNMSLSEIERDCGISRNTLYKELDRLGIPRKNNKR